MAERTEVDPSQRERQRFVRRQWSRRWLTWRPVLAVVLLLAALVGGGWLVFFSDHLALVDAEVTGVDGLPAQRVISAAELPVGTPLARVDLKAVQSRVEALAPVKSAEVSRAWPDGLRIEVTERVPLAIVEVGGSIRAMDAEGVLFFGYETAPDGLPRVVTGGATQREALAEGAKVIAALPEEVAAEVDHVEVRTVDRISLLLLDGRRVEWGSAEGSAEKARVLAALLAQPAAVYDVSVPGQPTTR
ncbi:cell division protein FtsQ/DivIB [Nocardioides limicola]|uniref:cell division protein FtsQ/DivIB n=1 Tax=Nocardioides limicola TaxID=2803368 RepID=UPI00193C7AAA|nr:FtsQ-type POTRA domain-containing protein [Nocardioides sp. DJM-14]